MSCQVAVPTIAAMMAVRSVMIKCSNFSWIEKIPQRFCKSRLN
jgi:hypothetical protein